MGKSQLAGPLPDLFHQSGTVDLSAVEHHHAIVESASPAEQRRLAWETESDTRAFAQALARRPGIAHAFIELRGDLGSGKTTFVRGALRALGVTGPVTSPTFTLGRRYDSGRIPAAHLDLHRLGALDDEDPGLLDPYVEPARVAFVEWPETARAELRAQARLAAEVTLEHAGGDLRRVTVEREPGAP